MSVLGALYSVANVSLRWVPGLQWAAQKVFTPGEADLSSLTAVNDDHPSATLMEQQAWMFDDAASGWVPVAGTGDEGVNPVALAQAVAEPFRVLTYNVMMDAYERFIPGVIKTRDRHTSILRMLRDSKIQVICLNEVDSALLEMLCAEPFVRERYYLSTISTPERYAHQVAILVSRDLQLRSLHTIHSFLAPSSDAARPGLRRAVVARVLINQRIVAIVAVHLEAYNSRFPARRQQLLDIYRAFDLRAGDDSNSSDERSAVSETGSRLQADQILILGDFNFHQEAENAAILSPYEDIWSTLRGDEPEENGFTWDAQRNHLIQAMWLRCDARRMRLDRAVLAGSSPLVPQSIDLFGEQTVGELIPTADGVSAALHPSDHFGLAIRFSVE